MISSMTGFAAAPQEAPRAASRRAEDRQPPLPRVPDAHPEELRPLEPAMREAVAARLTRGKVDCRITFTPAPTARRSVVPDADAMAALQAAANEVRTRFPEARPLSVSEVLHWPGVLADATLSADEQKEIVLALVGKAIVELTNTRIARGGAKLEAILRERLTPSARS
jgi:uncharacterized protein YicC (UPF0701 family)